MYMEKAKQFCDLCDVPIKGLTALFSVGLVTGGVVIWLYLGSIGMSGQLIAAISSTQTLIALAMFSAILTTTIISMMIGTPVLFERMLKSTKHRNYFGKKQLAIKTALFSAPSILFLIPILFDTPKVFFVTLYFCLLGLSTLVIFAFYCSDNIIAAALKKENIPLLGTLTICTLIITVTTLTFLQAILSPIFLQLLGDNWMSVIAVIIYLLFYALLAAITTSQDQKSYIPVSALIIYTLILSFSFDLPKNFAKKLNIGNFTESIIIDEKGYSVLAATPLFHTKQLGKESYLVQNVFVYLNVSNALTFSASEKDKERITLAASSIIATLKTIEKNTPPKL